ncbi:MAG: leucyl aminopeptidase [Bryobacterales bacterium]|jgi:leucyl aminopeptidase|nr:leucyl aminopeptidase [Bryobacterales bacterium]
MKLELIDSKAAEVQGAVLVLPAFEVKPGSNDLYSGGLDEVDRVSGGLVCELYRTGEFKAKPMEVLLLHRVYGLRTPRLMLVGCGDREKLNPSTLGKVAAAAVRALKQKSLMDATLYLDPLLANEANVAEIAGGALTGDFEVHSLKTQDKDDKIFALFRVAMDGGAALLQGALQKGQILGEAQNYSRNLSNLPGNLLPPRELVERAKVLARETAVQVDVLYRSRLEELGMGALLAVAQGSEEPPFLLHMVYDPDAPTSSVHLGLVGKAVTFDSGGISIKPADGMEKMKYDMSGGAAVMGAMQAIAALRPSIRVSAFVPIVENMPSGKAMRPGDILKSLSGKTIEVLNTDAEGRLILADAITYAKQQGCTHLVDAATLTGAIAVALGFEHVGLFCNQPAFCAQIQEAAKAAGERFWPMPLDAEYKEYLKSDFADIANIGGRWGGACTAAKFLEEFAGDTPWAHLDIAGTAWLETAKPYMPKGPTGVAVKTFVELAVRLASAHSAATV